MPRTGLTAQEIRGNAIDATLTKTQEAGFEKVRLTDIAKESDVSRAALYSHFKDKSELLDAVSERRLLTLAENLESIRRKQKNPGKKIYQRALKIHRTKF